MLIPFLHPDPRGRQGRLTIPMRMSKSPWLMLCFLVALQSPTLALHIKGFSSSILLTYCDLPRPDLANFAKVKEIAGYRHAILFSCTQGSSVLHTWLFSRMPVVSHSCFKEKMALLVFNHKVLTFPFGFLTLMPAYDSLFQLLFCCCCCSPISYLVLSALTCTTPQPPCPSM